MDHATSETSVYRYYDQLGILIYVGITGRGVKRNREHNLSKSWWRYVAHQEVDHFATRRDALDRERDLIETYRPPFNAQHNDEGLAMAAAYDAWRSIDSGKVAREIFKGLGNMDRALHLSKIGYDSETQIQSFRTRLDMAPLAARLVFIEDPRRLARNAHGGRAGRVVDMYMQGPLAVIRVRIFKPDLSFQRGEIRVKERSGKNEESTYEFRSVLMASEEYACGHPLAVA
jgi:hypothetical protein